MEYPNHAMKNSEPITEEELIADFRKIGILENMNIMVHSSLSKIGWVIGGAQSVIRSLKTLVGENGTIVMPAASPHCLHPTSWDDNDDIPAQWIPKIEAHLPVFDKSVTPTTMGAIPEAFRTWPGTKRSDHPISSVCANGPLANVITSYHNLEFSEGANTPYEKVYELNFWILLLGVGFNRCTMLHFAESKSRNKRVTISKYPVMKTGMRVWLEVTDMGNDNGMHFPKIGDLFCKSNRLSYQAIGNAQSILFPTAPLVNFGKKYFDDLN